jgi:HlyD family secretion protein
MSLTEYQPKPPALRPDGVPEPVAEKQDGPGREIVVGGIIAFVFFGLFLGWAAFAPLDAGAYASGKVVVSGNRQAVQHREGGIVSALHVKDGQVVQAGQVLMEISANELRAQERALAGQVIALQATRARLLVEQRGGSVVAPPIEFANLSPDDQQIAAEALRLEQAQLRTRDQAIAAQIQGYRRQVRSAAEQQRLVQDELRGMRELAEKGYAPQTRVRALERQAAELTGNEGAYGSQIATLQKRRQDEVVEQLRQVETQLGDLEPRLAAVRQQLARSLVRAPATGEVVGLTAHTVGGVVAPGQTLMEVVPRSAPLVVEAMINPTDGDDLRVGMTTEVRFSAFKERDLPMLSGTITKLSADALTDERTGMSYFKAEISVPPSEMAKVVQVRGEDTGLRPGLPAEIVVKLRKRTALEYLFEPMQQTFWRSFREH